MSKKLTKIIAISLLALIVPVAIVVTAICLSSAVTFSLKIDTLGYENVGAISYKVNGKDYEDGMRVKKDSKVTVTVETAGYDFDGWYNGSADSLTLDTEAVSTELSYTFDMTQDIELSTKSNIIVYSVKYDGAEAESVKYGSFLKDSTTSLDGKYFAGWKLDADNDGVLSDAEKEAGYVGIANFTEREVSLIASIEDVHYYVSYNGSEAVKLVYGSALADGTGVVAPTGKYFTGWELDGAPVTEAKFAKAYENGNVNLTATFETIKYSVKYNGADPVEVEYGSTLNTEWTVEEGKYLAGWTLEGVDYTVATFPATYTNGSVVELTPSIKDIHYMVSFDGSEAKDVAWGAVLENGSDRDRENGIVFDYWTLNGAKVESAKFEGCKNGDTVALVSAQKDLYVANDSYKTVNIRVNYVTADGKMLSKDGLVELMVIDQNYNNAVKDDNTLTNDFSSMTVGTVYSGYETVKELGTDESYALTKVFVTYKNADGERQSGEFDTTVTIAELINALEELAGDDMTSRTAPLTLNITFLYEYTAA